MSLMYEQAWAAFLMFDKPAEADLLFECLDLDGARFGSEAEMQWIFKL